MAGFHVFVSRVVAFDPVVATASADGVVVLTGGEDRIAAGVGLIEGRRGRRLLISGVNKRVGSVDDLARHVGGHERTLRCCVDLGHGAKDTIGNAEEARDWARANGFGSLIVVTSSYHMPRSLTEFAIAMPNVRLVPHAVPSRYYHLDAWWRHLPTTRLLLGEYVKFLTSLARYGLWRSFDSAGVPPATGRETSPHLSSI